MIDISQFYQQRTSLFSDQLAAIDKEIGRISLLRLASILLVVAGVYAGFSVTPYAFIGAAIFFALFLYFVKKHTFAFQKRVLIYEQLQLNQKEAAFRAGDKAVFEAGNDIDTTNHLYALDLDIFGTGSLFQAINRSSTRSGRSLLAQKLLEPLTTATEIENRKKSIYELKDYVNWRQEFYAVGTQVLERPADHAEIERWLALPDFFNNRNYWKVIVLVMNCLSALAIGYCIVTAQFIVGLLFVPIILNMFLYSFIAKPAKEYFDHFGSRTKQFKKYSDLFAHIKKQEFSSPELKQLKSECEHASAAFVKLFELSNLADARLNGMVGPIMNGFFLFDLWCIYRIENWRKKYAGQFLTWINSLVSIDMISSFANFSFNHPDFNDAIIQTDTNAIIAKEMAHPLMNSRVSVKNDYEIGVTTKIHVITGSNMAGKSTFIRALGVNLILARNGMPVCASEFKCSIPGLITSIRISDSLEENASYFKAELLRLEKILDQLKTGRPFLVLLDEILRGTNSDDKRLGTQSFLLKLKQYNCLVMLATHDLGVGRLEEQFPGYVENYCFESHFTGHELTFDYTLRKGVSSSTNATFLMKRMGLID